MPDLTEHLPGPCRILYAMLWPVASIFLGIVAGIVMSIVITTALFLLTLVRTPLHLYKMLCDTLQSEECFPTGQYLDPVMRAAIFCCVHIVHVLFLFGITLFSGSVGTLYYIGKSTKVFYNHEYRKTMKTIKSNARLKPKSYLGKYIETCQEYMADDHEASNCVIGALKFLLAIVPAISIAALVFVPFSIAIVAITLYRMPMNVYKTVKIALWTVVLQWDLRLVVLLMLPLIHTLFPLVAFACAMVWSIFWTWCHVTANIVEGRHPCNELEELKEWLRKYHKHHTDFVSEAGWGRYDHPTGIPLGWDGTSYGLEIERILRWQVDFVICCGMIVIQLPFCLAVAILIGAIKYVPSCLYLWKQYLKEYCHGNNRDCVSILSVWPFHVLALSLTPVGALLCHLLVVFFLVVVRFLVQIPWEFLLMRHDFRCTWEIPMEIILDQDDATRHFSGFAFFKDTSFERNRSTETSTNGSGKENSIATYWDRLASQSIQTTATLMEQGWISLDDVQAMEPAVIQSIPAVAILQVLSDSVNEKGLKDGDLKWSIDGTICKQNARPVGDGILNHLWPMVRDLKRTLQVNKKTALAAENLKVLTVMICANNEKENKNIQSVLDQASPANRALNNDIRTKINRLVLAILRVKPYQDRMSSILTHEYDKDDSIDCESGTNSPSRSRSSATGHIPEPSAPSDHSETSTEHGKQPPGADESDNISETEESGHDHTGNAE